MKKDESSLKIRSNELLISVQSVSNLFRKNRHRSKNSKKSFIRSLYYTIQIPTNSCFFRSMVLSNVVLIL